MLGSAMLSCVSSFNSSAQWADWELLQSVGGVDLGTPYLFRGDYYLPVIVDFSGTRTVSVPPTLINSGLLCIRYETFERSDVFETDVFFTIMVQSAAPAVGSPLSSTCPDLKLPALSALYPTARWNVYYQPHSRYRHHQTDHLIGVVTP